MNEFNNTQKNMIMQIFIFNDLNRLYSPLTTINTAQFAGKNHDK